MSVSSRGFAKCRGNDGPGRPDQPAVSATTPAAGARHVIPRDPARNGSPLAGRFFMTWCSIAKLSPGTTAEAAGEFLGVY